MNIADDKTEMDRLLQYLSEAERAEFLHLYYRVFKHTDPNDELITIFRALHFGYLLTAKVPERLAGERKELQQLIGGVTPAFQNAVKSLGSKFDQQVAMMDDKSEGLQRRLTELTELAHNLNGFGDWLRSPEGVQKQSRDIATQLVPMVREHLDRLIETAADLKADSLDLAAQANSRELDGAGRLRAIEEQLTLSAQHRARGLYVSLWSVSAVGAGLVAAGFFIARWSL